MDSVQKLKENLNEQQLEAVTETEGFVRVIAGAGSGKTKALTQRYAYIVEALGINSSNILCVTFTNKAAQEMRKRVKRLVGENSDLSYITTYHGFCVRVLREDINKIKYPKNFIIMDVEDQKTILRQVYNELGLTSKVFTFKQVLRYISKQKTSQEYLQYILESKKKETDNEIEKIFIRYLEKQQRNFALDFDDLLNFALYIFVNNTDVLEKWQKRLHYIQVDETQDSSQKQFMLIEMLSQFHKNLFVVGDPDQTIYEWRGAKPEILVDFDKQFVDSKTIIMNQNYRSTPNILNLGNHIIKNNKIRVDNVLDCTSFTTIDFTVNTFPTVGNNFSEEICFTENNPNQATLTLSDYNINFNTDTNQSIAYYNNQTDLDNENNAIDQNQQQPITANTQYLVRVNNADNTCFRQRSLTITIADDWQITNQPDSRCVNTGDNAEFNLQELANNLVSNPTNFTFDFFRNETDALNRANAITNFTNYETNQSETITVTITNQSGCTLYGEIALTINENPILQPASPSTCSETAEGQFNLDDIRSTLDPNNQFSIDFFASQTELDNNNPITSTNYNSVNTTILAVATNGTTGCETISSIPLTVNSFPTANAINEQYCDLETPVTINLNNLENQINSNEQVSILRNGETTPLTTDFTITANETLTATVINTVGCETEPTINYTIQQENTIQELKRFECIGDTVRIANLEITATGFYEVEDIENCTTTVYEYEFQNCEDVCQPAFPQAFAPNGNGRNEVFRFNTPQIGDCVIIPQNMQIFNRWGELVYEGIDAWDGSNADQGVYIYQFTYSSTSRYGNQEDITVVGNFTLVR